MVLAVAHLLIGARVPPGFPLVGELAAAERTSSFAVRRVLAPRPAYIQLLMDTADVAYTPARVVARVLPDLRRPSDRPGDATGSATWQERVQHVRFTLRCLVRSLSAFGDVRAEMSVDRWALGPDTIER